MFFSYRLFLLSCSFFLFAFSVQAEEKKRWPDYNLKGNSPHKEIPEEETHWPHYDSCQMISGQPFSINKKQEETEASFCPLCVAENSLKRFWGFTKLTTSSLEEKAFHEKLRDQVIGQMESKLFEIRLMKACAFPLKNQSWLTELYKEDSWSKIQDSCKKTIQTVKSEVKKDYPEMRVQLALTAPAIKEDRILKNKATWIDNSPSHLVSSFTNLPKLSKEEQSLAEKYYVESLSETPLDSSLDSSLSASEFKRRLEGGKGYLYSGKKYLSSEDTYHLKLAEQSLREESRIRYFELIGQNFLLGYVRSESPNNEELVQAYSEMEKGLTKFLEEEIKAPKENMSLLISYESLVEELLKEDKGEAHSSKYCLIAETTRIKAEKLKKRKENLSLVTGLASFLPCFFPGGVAISVCLGAAGTTSFIDFKEVQKEAQVSFNKRLTGKDFETVANLDKTQKELYLAKVFFSLTFLEAGGIIKVMKSARQSKLLKKSSTKKSEATRKSEAERRSEATRKSEAERRSEAENKEAESNEMDLPLPNETLQPAY